MSGLREAVLMGDHVHGMVLQATLLCYVRQLQQIDGPQLIGSINYYLIKHVDLMANVSAVNIQFDMSSCCGLLRGIKL